MARTEDAHKITYLLVVRVDGPDDWTTRHGAEEIAEHITDQGVLKGMGLQDNLMPLSNRTRMRVEAGLRLIPKEIGVEDQPRIQYIVRDGPTDVWIPYNTLEEAQAVCDEINAQMTDITERGKHRPGWTELTVTIYDNEAGKVIKNLGLKK